MNYAKGFHGVLTIPPNHRNDAVIPPGRIYVDDSISRPDDDADFHLELGMSGLFDSLAEYGVLHHSGINLLNNDEINFFVGHLKDIQGEVLSIYTRMNFEEGVNGWQKWNPAVGSLVAHYDFRRTHKFLHIPEPGIIGQEKMDIILGREGIHRRSTTGLEAYLSTLPDLGVACRPLNCTRDLPYPLTVFEHQKQ